MPTAERGFTIIEVLIAGAIVTLMALTGLAACQAVARITTTALGSARADAALDTQVTSLRNDAASAFAVFVPATDMNGAPNTGPGGGHEVDYYARGDGGQEFLWRYFYDPAGHTLQRFDYDPSGTDGVRDVATGRIDRAAAYPALTNITSFSALPVTADQLGDADRNLYHGLAALLPAPKSLSVSYNHPELDVPGAIGGNTVVQVTLANATVARVVHLAAAAMPTGFTVTGEPRWHAIVYRVDTTDRSWFGLAQKSHVYINARVDVTYDAWKTRLVWCDFNLLGQGDGLAGHDSNADPKLGAAFEQADSLLALCRKLRPTPPARDSTGNPPAARPQPLPLPTPPLCWTNPGPQGRCWPADAPDNWTPPAPEPLDTPPASWCATRAASIACRPPALAPQGPG